MVASRLTPDAIAALANCNSRMSGGEDVMVPGAAC
jgi:hypothetical protein